MADKDEPSRGIGSIAHWFLSQSGAAPPQSSDSVNRPRRVPPGRPAAQTSSRPPATEPRQSHRVAVIGPHQSDPRENILRLAEQWASEDLSVGLLLINNSDITAIEMRLDDECPTENDGLVEGLQADSCSEHTVIAGQIRQEFQKLFEPEGQLELPDKANDKPAKAAQMRFSSTSEAFGYLSARNDTILIGIGDIKETTAVELVDRCDSAIIVTRPHQDELVAGYKLLKQLQSSGAIRSKVSVFICDSPDEQTAQSAYERLSRTAEQFLDMELDLAAGELSQSESCGENITTDILATIQTEPAAIAELEKILRNDTRQVQPADEATEPVEEPVDMAGLPSPLQTIPIERLPQTDRQLIEALGLNLGKWLNVVSCPIVLPIAPICPDIPNCPARFIVDADGRAIVLFASIYPPDDGLLERAISVRDNFSGRIRSIMGRYRQVSIEASLDTGLILVAPGPLGCIRESFDKLAESHCFALQLYLLQNGPNDYSLLVTGCH